MMERVSFDDSMVAATNELIKKKESFEVTGCGGRLTEAATKVEQLIESQGLRCRIYTYGRVAAAGASFFGGITGVLGVASAVGMAAHNVATFNPDYEIAKHPIDNKLTVKYKKKK
ncbi:conserved hypothetical protein [Marinobacter nauticus VT8]|uniref:Uncharacterized protein n=2 Tax=Marinobacteraceae TaxID=2887365 RepID=A1U625_MARN8|nr:conserved hypothetical protein [Marinobacter nauticus VT8]